jgi:hypothetical protein
MTSAARTPGGDTPNDRPRQPDPGATPGAWNHRPQEPPTPREAHTPLSQADGHP